MAGWKLRKEKTQSETPETEPETTEPETSAEPVTAQHGAETYSALATNEEASAAEWDTSRQPLDLGAPTTTGETEHTPPPDFEAGDALHFVDEDSPLKLMDYSAPFTENLLPLSQSVDSPLIAAPPETPSAESPSAESPSAESPSAEILSAEMPTLATPSFDTSQAEPEDVAGDFTSTLRMSREELAAAFAPPAPSGIPPVAPFVLDAPLVSPATEEMPPRLVVRMGRLSAAFDLTKDVTVIGRPDSELHYYPDVEIDMDDAISRRHAEVIKRDDQYSLVDTGSTNGTLLNGEKLPPHEERMLTHGDRIRIGERTEVIFE